MLSPGQYVYEYSLICKSVLEGDSLHYAKNQLTNLNARIPAGQSHLYALKTDSDLELLQNGMEESNHNPEDYYNSNCW